MRQTFSQRQKLAPVRDTIQTDSLDEETRNALWNLITPFLKYASYNNFTVNTDIWTQLYHQTADTAPGRGPDECTNGDKALFYSYYRKKIIEDDWNEALNLIDFMAWDENQKKWRQQVYADRFSTGAPPPTPNDFNQIFEKYLVGYRFVNDELVTITEPQEIQTIETAIQHADDAVSELLAQALHFLADRSTPNYAKSIDCSISAVESQCRIILGGAKSSLGDALDELAKKGFPLHPALRGAFNKLYGYASDADGIRHGSIAPSEVDQSLSQFMLIACSAFINFLKTKR